MALLGEMHYIPSGPEAWVNLPREGGVTYVAQESWVLNETIRVCTCNTMRIQILMHPFPGEYYFWLAV